MRLLHFPYKHLEDKRKDKISQRIVWIVVIVTLLPSIYFGYDMISRERFTNNANLFITNEAHFPDDYLLNKKIDAKNKVITIIFGGKEIDTAGIAQLRSKLKLYDLSTATLEVKQGFTNLSGTDEIDHTTQLSSAIAEQEVKEKIMQKKLDSLNNQGLNNQVYAELKAQYPSLKSLVLQPSMLYKDSSRTTPIFLIMLTFTPGLAKREKSKIENWLKVRLQQTSPKLVFE